MKTATVGDIQKNFAKLLRSIKDGEVITVTKRGKPVAKITAMGPKNDIEWPDFYSEVIELKGKPLKDIVAEGREERF